jgi:hypothetical protein
MDKRIFGKRKIFTDPTEACDSSKSLPHETCSTKISNSEIFLATNSNFGSNEIDEKEIFYHPPEVHSSPVSREATVSDEEVKTFERIQTLPGELCRGPIICSDGPHQRSLSEDQGGGDTHPNHGEKGL